MTNNVTGTQEDHDRSRYAAYSVKVNVCQWLINHEYINVIHHLQGLQGATLNVMKSLCSYIVLN